MSWTSPSGRYVASKYITREWPSERGDELMVSHGLVVMEVALQEPVALFAEDWEFVASEGEWEGETFVIKEARGATLKIDAPTGQVLQIAP